MTRFGSTLAGLTLAAAVPAATAFAVTAQSGFATEPSALVFDQKISGDSVDVSYINMPVKGFAAVMKSGANGAPSNEALGSMPLNAGNHHSVKIKLTQAPKTGDKLWVTLYPAGADNKFDPAAKPVLGAVPPAESTFVVK